MDKENCTNTIMLFIVFRLVLMRLYLFIEDYGEIKLQNLCFIYLFFL